MAASSTAVRISAGITIVGSVATLALGVVILAAGLMGRPPESAAPSPIPFKVLMGGVAAFLIALAGWGLSTGICILLRQRWARISMLVFGGFLAFGFGSGSIMSFFMTPPPTTPDAQAMMPVVLRIIAVVYAIFAAIGVWWLVLFNRRGAREYFAGGSAPVEAGGRPLSISIIAGFLLLSAVCMLFAMLLRFPAMFFGALLKGWPAVAVYAGFLAVQVYSGVGLLRLRESGRIAAIAYFGFAIVHLAVIAIRGNFAGLLAETQKEMPQWYPTGPTPMATPPMGIMMAVSAVLCVIPILFLIRRRSVFNPRESGLTTLPQ